MLSSSSYIKQDLIDSAYLVVDFSSFKNYPNVSFSDGTTVILSDLNLENQCID